MHLPKVIAHRGASQITPENTVMAFEKAHELGATMVEFDVMLTQDNIVIVHHDDTLARIIGLNQNVNDTSYAAIQNKDAGSWLDKKFASARIPTFEQVLTCCAKAGLAMNIELKTNRRFAEQTALRTLALLAEFKFFTPDTVLFTSLEPYALEVVHAQAPQYLLGLVADNWPDVQNALALGLDLYSLSLHYPMITPDKMAAYAHYQILAFTVNDRALAEQLFKLGVCSVFSDNALLLKS